MTIADNINRVQETIQAACARAGRDPAQITLVAVSKTHSPAVVLQAAELGVQHFGENRVEESGIKIPAVLAETSLPLIWHMVGHIQSRKARLVPPLFQVVHSLDSLKLAMRLSQLMLERNEILDVLVEVNVSGEETKGGLSAYGWSTNKIVLEQLQQEIGQISALPGLNMRGLMTVAPIVENSEQTRPIFADLAKLRAVLIETLKIPLPDLSMGMTDDYPVAIEEGATIVRIGRAIFGEPEK